MPDAHEHMTPAPSAPLQSRANCMRANQVTAQTADLAPENRAHHLPKYETFIQGPDAAGKVSCKFFAFDTVVSLVFYVPCSNGTSASSNAHTLTSRIVAWCRHAESLISAFISTSDIARINTAQGAPVHVDKLTWNIISKGIQYSQQSHGAFDITMGGVCRLWDFKRGILADQKELSRACKHVGWHNIRLSKQSENSNTVYIVQMLDPQTRIDLGGIAKGYFADTICHICADAGVTHMMANLGGNVVVAGGKPDRTPWHVGIRRPAIPHANENKSTDAALYSPAKNEVAALHASSKDEITAHIPLVAQIPLFNGSVVTSGPYERYFTKDGTLYHHILDTHTGMPAHTDLASASIISKHSIDGDGYSTTLFALGSTQALTFVNACETIEAILIRDNGEIILSSGLINQN